MAKIIATEDGERMVAASLDVYDDVGNSEKYVWWREKYDLIWLLSRSQQRHRPSPGHVATSGAWD